MLTILRREEVARKPGSDGHQCERAGIRRRTHELTCRSMTHSAVATSTTADEELSCSRSCIDGLRRAM